MLDGPLLGAQTPAATTQATKAPTPTAMARKSKAPTAEKMRTTSAARKTTARTSTTASKPKRTTAKPKPTATSAKDYANCTALNADYPHGVGRPGARDKTSGTPVTSFTASRALYAANSESDRDNDGIACEKS
jgi:Excalibur calcium-binding domain